MVSSNFTMVDLSAECKKSVHTDFMYRSISVVVREAALKRVEVSSSFSISASFNVLNRSASLLSYLDNK